jgi:putative ABC transport system permease protein
VLRIAWRGLLAHKVRLVATVLSVVLGVAFMAGTQVFTDTFSKSFDDIFTDVNRGTDAVVRSNQKIERNFGDAQRSRISETVVPEVQRVAGVKAAEGSVRGSIRIIGKDGKPTGDPQNGPPTFGLNWMTDPQLSQWKVVDGHEPRGPGELVVDKATATAQDLHLGDPVSIAAGQGQTTTFTLVGVATFGKADNFSGAPAALFDTATAQAIAAEPGKFDWIAVAAQPGVSQNALVDHLRAAGLPTDTEVISGAQFTKESQDTFRKAFATFKTFLLVFALVALFVGSFIIYNTFSIIVAQRTREVAMLRAIGASRRQVLGSVVAESAIVGLLASAVGIGVGIVLALLLKAAFSAGGGLPPGSPVITVRTVVVSLVIGVLVTVVSAVFPARRAARVAPVAAMRDVAIDTSGQSRIRVAAGVLLALIGALVLFKGLFTKVDSPLPLVGGGIFFVFVGVAVLGPILASPMSRIIGWPIARFGGVTGQLARENARRSPKRTASTASALMIAVGLVSFIAIAGQSLKASTTDLIDQGIKSDFVVDSGSFVDGGLNPRLTNDIAAVPGVATAAGLRLNLAKVGEKGTLILAFDPTTLPKIFRFNVIDGSFDGLGTAGVMIDKKTAVAKNLTLGSPVTLTFGETGTQEFHVRAVYDSTFPLPGGSYLISDAAYDANYPVNQQVEYQIYVKLDDGVAVTQVREPLEHLTDAYPTAKLQDLKEYKHTQLKQIDQFLLVIYVLLGLSLIIAVIGIINTLLLSVYERVREIGLLRAVGETRGQVRSTVRWEAVIIAVLGTLLGVVIGLFFGWALVKALYDEGVKVFQIPYGQLGLFVVVAGTVGVLAALYPAFRAARLNILDAISTE